MSVAHRATEAEPAGPAEEVCLFKRLLAYYLPFDQGLAFQIPWIWQNARQYAYRNAIACVALVGLSLTAKAYQLTTAATATHALAIITTFFATVFTFAAIDHRLRE